MGYSDFEDDKPPIHRRKPKKSKRQSIRAEHDSEYNDLPVKEDDNYYSKRNIAGEETVKVRRSSRSKKGHYLNAGFVEDENDFDESQQIENPIRKKKKKKARAENDHEHKDSNEELLYDNQISKPAKSKRPKQTESFNGKDNEEEPIKEEKKKKKRLKETTQDIPDEQYYSMNDTSNEVENVSENHKRNNKKQRTRHKKSMPEDTDEVYLQEPTNKENYEDHLEDTGYESFNKRVRRKKHKSKKDDVQEVNEFNYEYNNTESFNEIKTVSDYNLDKNDQDVEDEKIYRKKRKGKARNRKKEEKDECIEDSPSAHPKIIQVHGKKPQKKSHDTSVDLSNEIDNLLEEMDEVESDFHNKNPRSIGKSTLETRDQYSDDNFDEVDLELEEMLLLTDRRPKQNDNTPDVSLTIKKKTKHSNKKRKDSAARLDADNIDMYTTEVVPFSINNSFDSDTEQPVEEFSKHSNTSNKITNKSNTQACNESVQDNGAKKPLKMYAFGNSSNSEDESKSSSSEDEEEIDIPVKKSVTPSFSQKPPKARKSGIGSPPAPVLTQSSNFSQDGFTTDASPVHDKHKPPRPTRKSLFELPRSRSPSASHHTTSSGQPTELKGIFSIDGHSYDVQQKDECITWTSVAGVNKVPRSRKKSFVRGLSSSGGSFRGSIASLGTAEVEEMNTLYYQDILGIMIKKEKKSSAKYAEGVCVGIVIYTFDKKEENRLKDRPILFQHPSELECTKWVEAIKEKLEEFIERPKSVKVIVQPFAGVSKSGRLTYNTKVKPLFDVADIKEELTIVNHNEHIKQEVAHLELSNYDCIVVVGGDGTVNQVVTSVLNKTQDTNGVDKFLHFTPTKPSCSIGVIPTGTTNHIVHSVQGVEDAVTSAIHIILGTTQPVDVCSVYKEEQFFTWSFNAHYGFFGNVLLYLNRERHTITPSSVYSLFADNKVNAAFVKALTKSKFRSYECEVQYIPISDSDDNHPRDGRVCNTGCKVCNTESDISDELSTHSDEVQALDQLDNDPEDGVLELKHQGLWKTIKGQFHNISVFSVPGNMETMCPRGMSMFTHLANGLIDLALIENIEKKQFIRYLKRHGKAKDQFDFPFIHTYRCKEVRFQLRMKDSWKHKDQNFSEIDYEMKKAEESEKNKNSDDVEVIDELNGDSSDEDKEPVVKKRPRKPAMAFLDESDEEDKSENDSENGKKDKKKNKGKDKKSKKDKKEEKKAKKEEKKDKKDKKEDKKDKKEYKKDKKEDKKDDNSDECDKPDSATKKRRSSFWSKLGKKKKGNKNNPEEENSFDEKLEDEVVDFNGSSQEIEDTSKQFKEFLHELELTSSSEEEEEDDAKTEKKGEVKPKKKSIFHVTPGPGKKSDIDHLAMHREYVEKQKLKKEDKERLKFEKRMKSFWNIDNEIHDTASFHFRIHQGLILIHGSGISPSTDPEEIAFILLLPTDKIYLSRTDGQIIIVQPAQC